jgi:hypothetical protein
LRLRRLFPQGQTVNDLIAGFVDELESIAKSIASDHLRTMAEVAGFFIFSLKIGKAEDLLCGRKRDLSERRFTMQTIGNSIALLQVVCRHRRQSLQEWRAELSI